MNLKLLFITIIISVLFSAVFAANILAIIPTASFSHQIAFRPLWIELDKRGHNLTLVTTDPMNNSSLKNVKEIDISKAYEYMEMYKVFDYAMNDSKSFREKLTVVVNGVLAAHGDFFGSAEGQNLIHNADNQFDLLFAEAELSVMTTFSWKYQIPYIGLSSLDCNLPFHEAAGNLLHPVINPDANLPIENPFDLSFWERLISVLYSIYYRFYGLPRLYAIENREIRKYFGENVPAVQEIMKNNLCMLFIVTSPIFLPVRPLMPNTITLGNGIHIRKAQKPIQKDVKDFLDGAKIGAIYFSLGSNIKGKHLNESTKNEIIKAFGVMPYRILWKIDDIIENVPRNVRVEKWFSSQPDILLHHNVKLFITQGGLQSMQESIYAGKPMLGIPYFGDQFGNVNRMVKMGYGLKINKNNITKESLLEAVSALMTNPKYTQKAQDYQKIFRDVEIPNVDKAIWWTEHVLRHKGAKHYRNPLLDIPFWQNYMLDVFAFLFIILLGIFKILQLIFNKLSKLKIA